MSYRIFITFLLVVFVFRLEAQQVPPQPKDGYKNTRKGNESFKKNNFDSAEKYYSDAVQTDTNKSVANYNLGNALYKQKKYEEASQAYSNSTAGTNPDSLSKSWYNLGNSMLQQQKYQESINAYKQALKLKPNDEETRYNLAYAQSKFKKQNPPPKQNKNQQNKNQKQQQQQQKQQQQQQQQQNQQQQNQQQQKQQQAKDQQQEQNPAMSKEEAQRMLDALKDNEKKIRDRMNQKKTKSAFSRSKQKDW